MRALVTGGTGLVGVPLVRRLLADGWEVHLLTRDAARAAPFHGAVVVHEADPSDAEATTRVAARCESPDVCFHLAASMDYFGELGELRRANVEGTRNVLQLAIRAGARRVVHVSSIEAMGPVSSWEVPAPVSLPCRPLSPYGVSKREGEQLVRDAVERSMSAAIVRIGNVYSERHFSFVVEIASALLTRARLLEFLPLYRDRYLHPVHVDDVVAGLLKAADPQAPSGTVMVGGAPVRVGDLFELSGELLGRRIPDRRPHWTDGPFVRLWQRHNRRRGRLDLMSYIMTGSLRRVHRAYSITEAAALFGYSPQVAIRSGMRDALAWHHASGSLSRGPVH